MTIELAARVELQEKVRFIGYASGEQSIVIDYPPPLGDDTGVRGGLELLLMSLAACAGQTAVAILRRMQQPLRGCVVEARGVRRDEHPTIMTDIRLGFQFTGRGLEAGAVQRAVALAETQYCPVWAMLRDGTRISSNIEIVESDSTGA